MKQIAIVYYSFTGNVYRMVRAFEKGIEEAGGSFSSYKIAEVNAEEFFKHDILVMASPANSSEEIEKTYFQPFMKQYADCFRNKKVFLFGSYGWGGGKYMLDWKQQLEDLGAFLLEEPIVCNGNPKAETKEALQKIATKLVQE